MNSISEQKQFTLKRLGTTTYTIQRFESFNFSYIVAHKDIEKA